MRTWAKTSIYHRPIGLVKPSELIRIRDEWLKSLKPATVARRFALLSNLYTVAKKDWLFTYIDNPVLVIRKPIAKDSRSRRLHANVLLKHQESLSEIDWIIRQTKSQTLPIIITLAIETAMRRSEIVNIMLKAM